jgi:hypothetical protein
MYNGGRGTEKWHDFKGWEVHDVINVIIIIIIIII